VKKFVVLVFAIAALAFLSELTARDGFSFAFGFPIPIPSIDGPVYYNPIPKTVIIRDMSTMAGITARTGATGITTAAAIT
jgi:hypothetical protein